VIANMKLMKRMNRARVLSLLREGETLSRVRLKELTGLDGTTVTNLTRDLLKKRMLLSRGYERSTGGRRPQLLALNPGWKLAIGVYLGPRRIRGVLADLRGRVQETIDTLVGADASRAWIFRTIKEVTSSLRKGAGASRVLGGGLAVTGMPDGDRRTIVQSAFFPELAGTNLLGLIEDQIKAPAEMDVSSRCLARAEQRFGAARGLENFVLLELGRGVGCAIVAEGRLQSGASAGAGELGHTVVVEDGERCPCGHRGCLETVASVGALERDARKRLRRRALSFDDIVVLADKGDGRVLEIVRGAGFHVGIAASHIVNILNPSHIVVGGELARLGTPLLQAIDTSLKAHSMPVSYDAVDIHPAQFGEDMGAALGAAALIIDKVFEAAPAAARARLT